MARSASLSQRLLQLDGAFLAFASAPAMVVETIGHYRGVGPFARNLGSPYTIGGFEAHGLALIFAVLLLRAARLDERHIWHWVALVIHLFLGAANLLFWASFVYMDVVPMGVVATTVHALFVVAHVVTLRVAPTSPR